MKKIKCLRVVIHHALKKMLLISVFSLVCFMQSFAMESNSQIARISKIDRKIVLSEKYTEQNPQKSVSGKVTDSSGATLPGVTVVVKGTTIGTVTDSDGKYTIPSVTNDNIIVFSFIGMKTQEIKIGGETNINVTMQKETIGIEEVVAVGYGTQRKINVTGSVSAVKSEELAKIPVSSVTNALAGKLPGLITLQSSGQPGKDASSLNIRGFGDALVIVDGVETDFKNIDANQIENITILKDGAASIYGSRAGNGVILITTKRGAIGKPTFTFNATTTLQKPTQFQELLSSGQYTTILSEQHLQSGQPVSTVPYTPEQIQKYYEAKEPGYYNTDWKSLCLRDWAPMKQFNFSVSGGSKNIKYYGFIGTTNQESFWKKNGGDYKRYNIQSNVDANITDNLTMGITISNIINNINSTKRAQDGGGYLFADLYSTRPMYPASLPDLSKIPYAGSVTGGPLVQSNRDVGGYSDNDTHTLNESVTLDYNFKSIKGLSLKAFGNYLRVDYESKSYGRPVNLYTYNVDTQEYTLAAEFNSDSPLSQQKAKSISMSGQFSVNYNNIIKDVHNIKLMLLSEIYTTKYDYISAQRSHFPFPTIDQMFAGSTSTMSNDGATSEMGRMSYIGRLNYRYKEKYLAEVIFRADASAKFPPSSRWGYFPSFSLGWRINEENFMKQFKSLDQLKFRVSYGSSGYDNVGNFQYLAGYTTTLTTALWGGVPTTGIKARGMANKSLSWEKITIYNAGIDYSFFNQKLYGEADVFYRERTGIPAYRTVSLPSSFGISLPLENLNSQKNRGFELKVGTAGKRNNLEWDISGNISWQRAKWGHVEEVDYTDPDQIRIYKSSGQWVDRTFGYLSDGLFTSQDQIDNLTFTYPGDPTLKIGDVRYVDTNNDHKLDWRDQIEIGKGTIPEWMGALNISLKYKKIDFSALFQGAFGFYKFVHLSPTTRTFFDERWTEANNNADALIPRLGGAATNGELSDRNFIKSDYVRLKTFSIGYSLPKSALQKISIQNARIFIGGSNLFTISKLNKYDLDAEAPHYIQDGGPSNSYYPQQKTVMLGINMSL